MRNWNPIQELIPTPIDAHQYEENLAELAEILYEYLSKLDHSKPIGPDLHDRDEKENRHE